MTSPLAGKRPEKFPELTPDEQRAVAAILTPDASFPSDAWSYLHSMLTEQRRTRMNQAVSGRTRRVRLVVQDVHQPHNVSACLRSADAFGVQDVDVVTLHGRFKPSTVAKGVAHWLTVRRHQAIESCVDSLRAGGYRIYAGMPSPTATPLGALPPDEKIAVVFGNEHAGIDPAWSDRIDGAFTIPMYGMVESLNISVCAAITLQHLTTAARSALPPEQYNLTPAEREVVLNAWVCRHVTHWQGLLERLRDGQPVPPLAP